MIRTNRVTTFPARTRTGSEVHVGLAVDGASLRRARCGANVSGKARPDADVTCGSCRPGGMKGVQIGDHL